MGSSRIEDFFYSGNAVGGEPDYRLADTFVRTAEAFANTTYQSVYMAVIVIPVKIYAKV